MEGETGGEQEEWMNPLKNENLMTAKLLINVADTGIYVCVGVCARACLLAGKADYEIRWSDSGK